MPTPYTPVSPARPAFPWNLVKDGEPYNFDSIQQSADPVKGLFGLCMDAIGYLLNRVEALAGDEAGTSITRMSQTPAIPTSGTWSAIGGTGDGYYQNGAAGAGALAIPLDAESLPHGCTLSAISVQITPDNSHVSIVGLTLPQIYLYETTPAGISTQVGTTGLDPSLTFTAYNLKHAITITGLTKVIDRQNSYALRFNQEFGGANEKANTKVFGVSVTRTAL